MKYETYEWDCGNGFMDRQRRSAGLSTALSLFVLPTYSILVWLEGFTILIL